MMSKRAEGAVRVVGARARRSIRTMTGLSLLSAAAFASAVFGGCSSDKGTAKKSKDSGIVVLTPDNPVSNQGSSGSEGDSCPSNQDADFISPTCQACLGRSCCEELQTCFELPADDEGSKVDCNGYASCLDECATKKTQTEVKQCYDECDDGAAAGVAKGYAKIEDCAVASCKAACTGE